MSDKMACILVLLLVIAFAGCKNSGVANKKTVSQKSKDETAQTVARTQKEELKVEKEVYSYEAKGRRDPFMSLVELTKEKPVKRRGVSPIENFDVEEIKLVAIAWDNQTYYAMITLPDSKSYTIKKGMTLGLYGGKVQDLTVDSLLIREQIKDYKGQFKTKDTLLRLRKEGEE